ncbi:MAG: mandelate racemase/muconate lactonizing enzyme family protein, partial [Gammaproteobacteria bacterium]|nr:mandelate racemase/muconate lactonizing enzyme family protein [Gammaproteobacteria bacterium]
MKITGLRCVQVEIPLEKPIRTAIHDVRSVGCVLVYLDTDEGFSGEAYNFTMNAARLDVLQAMIESLAPHVVGRD